MSNQNIIGPGIKNGIFIKTAAPQLVEVLGLSGLDFGVIDAEHAAFDRNMIDLMMIAGRAANLPLLVRIPDKQPATILQVLDMGAAGILVPHVNNAVEAKEIVACARYRNGKRGFSGAPRANGYGTLNMKACLDAGDATAILCQIESCEGLAAASEIAQVEGVDALFIGRADLALAMGYEDSQAAAVTAATKTIIAMAKAANKIAALFVGGIKERDQFTADGATCFVVSSDQSLLRQSAQLIAAPATR